MKETVTRSWQETQELANSLLVELRPHQKVIALHGDLGSGKTCFVQGLGHALNIQQTITSPTFTMVNEYKGARALYHIDLYRLHTAQDALAIGLDEYLEADGITAIEWAERAADLLPENTIHICFKTLSKSDERLITIESS